MNEAAIQEFGNQKLAWARKQFESELHSDFQRCRTFTSFHSQALLRVLRDRSDAELEILARVLPLGVLADTPRSNEHLEALELEEKTAVRKLRDAKQKDHLLHYYDGVQRLARKDKKEVKAEFNIATRAGNELIKELARRWNGEATGAARGEWGLIFRKRQWRICVSLFLGRHMELGYSISISDSLTFHTLCFHYNYLWDLGIAAGGWDVETSDQFPDAFLKAAEFAIWHKNEYEAILDRLPS